MSFPDVPFDEKLFESNELLRSYWDRATDSKAYEIPEGFLESEDLRDMTEETFPMEEKIVSDKIVNDKVDPVEVAEVIHAKTEEIKSDLVFEKSTPGETVDEKNTKWVLISFIAVFVVTFVISKIERY